MMWFESTDVIAQTMNIPILEAYDLNIMVYLSAMSYVNYKNNKIDQERKNSSLHNKN